MYPAVGLVIGFDRQDYLVFENQTQFSFGVSVISGSIGTDVNDLFVTIRILNNTSVVDLIFSLSIHQQNITQNVQGNNLYNGMQTSSLRLSRSLQSNSNPNITFRPSSAVISVVDDEGNP